MYWRRRVAFVVAVLCLVIVAVVGESIAHKHLKKHHHRDDRESGPARRARRQRARTALYVQENAAIDRILGYTSFFRQGRPIKREVALTFDDGPGPYTPSILRVLRRMHVPATFFEVGSMLDYFHSSLREEVRRGDVIGNHTEDHAHLGELDQPGQAQQLDLQEAKVRKYGGPPERLFRPPYGSYGPDTLSLLSQRGYLMVLWSVDTEDYERMGAREIADKALAGAEPGAIILMHDAGGDRSETVAALPDIIRGLRRRHLRPVTVPRLALDDPPPRDQQPPTDLSGG